MKKERKVWAMTIIAFWWLAPNQTIAQQDSVKTVNINEIVVTATKFPKSQMETGKVLTVIDEDQLRRSAGKDVSQLLNEQVGIVINGAGSNPGKDKSVFLRGAKGEHTLVLLDGVPLTDPSGIGGGAYDLRLIPIDQIERIEILKGSQSALYGSDAIAGVINIITKKGGNKPIGGFGTLSYGSYKTLKGNAGLSGSTAFIDYNLGYTRYQSDGISEAYDETGKGNFDKDGFEQNAYQLNVSIKPTDNFVVRPFVRYADFSGDYDSGPFDDDPAAVYDSKLLNFGANSQYTFGKGAVNLMYAHDKTSRDFNSAFSFPTTGHYDHAEVFANYNLTKNLQVLGGLSYQYLQSFNDNPAATDTSLNITSPYLSLLINNLYNFSIEIGGRYVDHSVNGKTFTYSINPSYRLNGFAKLFLNYSTGFKAPTLLQLYGQYGANPSLKPEESKSFEGGFNLFTSNKKADIRATFFSRKIDNAITYTNEYLNLDEQDDYGFEIEPNIQVNDKLSIRAFYAFVTGEVKTRSEAGLDTTYNNLLRKPKHSFGVNASYNVTNRLTVSVNFKTFGKRSDLFFNMISYKQEQVELTSYQLLDIYAEYRLLQQKLKLFVDAKNVLDQNYTEVYGYSTQNFNIQTGLSFSF